MKKAISLILCILMLTGSLSLFVSAREEHNDIITWRQTFVDDDWFIIGDADGNGAVNALDAVCIRKSVAGLDTEICTDAADFTADGELTSADVFYLKTLLAGTKTIADFDSSNRVASFRIGGVEISDFKFVLPEGTTYDDNIYFAYELLYSYIERSTGVVVDKIYAPEKTEHGIYFHDATGTEMGDRFGDDGFLYEEKNGNLHIYGTLRGNMYAAYDIIEDYLGFLFYDNVFTLSSKKRCSDIKAGTYNEEIPGFKSRIVVSTAWGSTSVWTFLPRRLNSASLLTNADSYYGYSQGSRFLNAHSYWYYQCMGSGEMPEDDGTMTLYERYQQKYKNGGGMDYVVDNGKQPCAVDDATFETLYQGMLDTLEMCKAGGMELLIEEGITSVSFSMNDSADYCTCRFCKTIANGGEIKRLTKANVDICESMLEWYPGYMNYDAEAKTVTFKKEGYIALYVAMAGRAAERIQEVYPGAMIETIIYGYQIPESIKPVSHMALNYCGAISGCANHHFGSDKCNVTGQVKDDPAFHSIADDEAAILYWIDEAKQVGSTVSCAIYASDNYTFYLYDLPCYFDLYYNIQWLYEHGVVGTGDDSPNNANAFNGLECLKSKLFAELEWNPTMSFDEYVLVIKKYLKAIYGYGYEHVYNYLVELCNAHDAVTVCVPYFSAAFDFYSKSYIRDHYEYMRNELLLAKAEKGSIGKSIHTDLDRLFMTCEVLGLSASYDSMYTNGTAESRAVYEQRYTDLYNYLKANNVVFSSEPSFVLPSTISFDASPLIQFYHAEHRYKASGYWCE